MIKIPLIQYLFGISSMRQTIKDIELNMAYRWFLGFSLTDPGPHFSTFGKNYKRRFEGTALAENIFYHILYLCVEVELVDPTTVFIDRTHIKACTNGRKFKNKQIHVNTKWLAEELEEATQANRVKHGKKELKPSNRTEIKNQKVSLNNPDSGWFHKEDHKQVFAYNVQMACDQHGWILGYSVCKGNTHDTQAFPELFQKIQSLNPHYLVADAGYKTPTIAHFLLNQAQICSVFPYTRPRRKPENRQVVYDEYFDCYFDEEDRVYHYHITNRKGHREY